MAQAYGDKHKTAPNEADTSYKNFIHNKNSNFILSLNKNIFKKHSMIIIVKNHLYQIHRQKNQPLLAHSFRASSDWLFF